MNTTKIKHRTEFFALLLFFISFVFTFTGFNISILILFIFQSDLQKQIWDFSICYNFFVVCGMRGVPATKTLFRFQLVELFFFILTLFVL